MFVGAGHPPPGLPAAQKVAARTKSPDLETSRFFLYIAEMASEIRIYASTFVMKAHLNSFNIREELP